MAKGCCAGVGKCHYAEFVRLCFLLYRSCLYDSADEIVYPLDNELFVNIFRRGKDVSQKQTILVGVDTFAYWCNRCDVFQGRFHVSQDLNWYKYCPYNGIYVGGIYNFSENRF
jgi:hypothetical protein